MPSVTVMSIDILKNHRVAGNMDLCAQLLHELSCQRILPALAKLDTAAKRTHTLHRAIVIGDFNCQNNVSTPDQGKRLHHDFLGRSPTCHHDRLGQYKRNGWEAGRGGYCPQPSTASAGKQRRTVLTRDLETPAPSIENGATSC